MPIGIKPDRLQQLHESALSYDDYLAVAPERAEPWLKNDERIQLTQDQQTLLAGFIREMHVLVLSGVWCGDCSSQGPMLAAIASASSTIDLRWLDRDNAKDLSAHLAINAGHRVPIVLFMAEDFEPVSVMGDRTLTRYRSMAAKNFGASCNIPGALIPEDEYSNTLQDWLNEFERVQLLLRLSDRLRQKHGD